MAGLWEENNKATDDGSPVRTMTIITTQANETMSSLHHRMPVLLSGGDFETWLDPAFKDVDRLKELLVPAAEDYLSLTPVSKRVNSPRHDDAACVQPVVLDT